MAKIMRTATGSYIVTIPKDLIRKKGWSAGTILNFEDFRKKSAIVKEVR